MAKHPGSHTIAGAVKKTPVRKPVKQLEEGLGARILRSLFTSAVLRKNKPVKK